MKKETHYKNFEELIKDNPEAVIGPEYLEKPDGGWRETENGFMGIGYHGNEEGCWYEGTWEKSALGRGHIPSNGYG